MIPSKRKTTKYIVVHCSATQPKQDIGAEEIRKWHLAKGWYDIGYHKVIRRDGTIESGRWLESVGAHVEGHNSYSIGICLVGGIDEHGKAENNFTQAQFESLRGLVLALQKRYDDPEVLGHRDFPNVHKDCPCFDVREWTKSLKK